MVGADVLEVAHHDHEVKEAGGHADRLSLSFLRNFRRGQHSTKKHASFV